ncbi:MAG: glycerol-3-phosphate acyltransferase PlsX [Rhodothermales bacterium]|jgi:glycerol-3-phosphate acyltransferase PlsX
MTSIKPIKLALDINGGDFGPDLTVAAACDAIKLRSDLEIILVGLDTRLESELEGLSESQCARIKMVHAAVVLESGVGPVAAIRHGNKSSMGRAIELVSVGEADACVSAGSTTALMALSIKMIGMLDGLKRPALMARIPSAKGFTNLLDLGANLNVDAIGLVQFAIMGVVAKGASSELEPSVGLLNVGHEDSKGHSVVKAAHERLKELPLNYQGFIEGNDIFSGKVDVAVCDGFSGNLVLKSSEELARMLFREVKEGFKRSWRTRLGALLAGPGLRAALARFEPAQHNGAPLLGLKGVVVKSHGSANRAGVLQAILEASDKAGRKVPGRIQTLIAQYEAETK